MSAPRYELDAREAALYDTKVRPKAFEPKPERRPKGEQQHFLLAGQPGAGKSGLWKLTFKELRKKGSAVHADMDEYRDAHPEKQALYDAHGPRASYKTHALAGAWMDKVLEEAAAPDEEGRRFNVVQEGTARDPDWTTSEIRRIQKNKYQYTLRVMAVPALYSRAGIIGRYVAGIEKNNRDPEVIPRYVPQEAHDDAYDGLVRTVRAIEKEGLCKVEVYERGTPHPTLVARFDEKNPVPGAASEKLQEVRNERWSPAQVMEFQESNERTASRLAAALEERKGLGRTPHGEEKLFEELRQLDREAEGMLRPEDRAEFLQLKMDKRLQEIQASPGVDDLKPPHAPRKLFDAYARDLLQGRSGAWDASVDEAVASRMLARGKSPETVVDALATSPSHLHLDGKDARKEARKTMQSAQKQLEARAPAKETRAKGPGAGSRRGARGGRDSDAGR